MQNAVIGNLIKHIRQSALETDSSATTDGRLLESFLTDGDENAFTTLVHRHGAMVFGVCQRILANAHDAEDAFQAAFLVVVQKAASLKNRQTIGNWLYGVACKTALKARAMRKRRQEKEREMAMSFAARAHGEDVWRELAPLLDEELSRLPDKYREPIVLCDLEGKSRKEASRQLGWPEGTVAGRLARGRIRLAQRLKRRGVTLAGGSLAVLVSQNAVSASVPASLVKTTIETAQLASAGQSSVCVLAKSVLRDMSIGRFKVWLASFGMIAAVIAIIAGITHATGGQGSAPAISKTNNGGKVLTKDTAGAAKLVHVWSVAWSPDGKHIASGSFDGTVRIWSRAGKVIRVLKGHRREVTSVAWSPNGTKLASASFDGTVRIWRRDGTPGPVMKGHNGVVAAVAWSADGRYLASGGFTDNTVRIWNADGRPGPVLKGHSNRVHSVAWHPKRYTLASGSYDGTVRLWDANGRPTGPGVLKSGGGRVYAVAWGQDGILLAAANHDGTIGLWDLGYAEIPRARGPTRRIEGHNWYAIALAWSRDGSKLASSGADKLVRIYEARSNFKRSAVVLEGHDVPEQPGNRYSHEVHSVSWSPNQKHIVSGGMDGSIRLWDAKTGKLIWVRDTAGPAPARPKTNGKKPKRSAAGVSVKLLNAKLPADERAQEGARLIAEYLLAQKKLKKSKQTPKVTKQKAGWTVRYNDLSKQVVIRVLDKDDAEFKRMDKNGNGKIDGKDIPREILTFGGKPDARLKGDDLKFTADLLKRIDKRIAGMRSKHPHLSHWDRPVKTRSRKFGNETRVFPDPKSTGKLLLLNTTDANRRHLLYYHNQGGMISLRVVHASMLFQYSVIPRHFEYGNAAVIISMTRAIGTMRSKDCHARSCHRRRRDFARQSPATIWRNSTAPRSA